MVYPENVQVDLHSEPQAKLPTSSLKARYFLLPPRTRTVWIRRGPICQGNSHVYLSDWRHGICHLSWITNFKWMRGTTVVGLPLYLQVGGQVHTSSSCDRASFSHLSYDAYASDLGRYLQVFVKKCIIEICNKRQCKRIYYIIDLLPQATARRRIMSLHLRPL